MVRLFDQWIYYLKNNEIKDEFNAQGIDKVRKLWRVDNLSEEDQNRYKRHLENLHYQASMEWTLKIEAEDKIKEKGKIEGKIEVAKSLLENGIDIEIIIKSTGLTKKQIEKLKE